MGLAFNRCAFDEAGVVAVVGFARNPALNQGVLANPTTISFRPSFAATAEATATEAATETVFGGKRDRLPGRGNGDAAIQDAAIPGCGIASRPSGRVKIVRVSLGTPVASRDQPDTIVVYNWPLSRASNILWRRDSEPISFAT